MSLTDYEGIGQIQVNNQTLAEASTVRVNGTSNNNKVYTMRKGLAGKSDGPREVSISIENAVPKGGLEQEWDELMYEGAKISVTHLFGGKRKYYDGWIDSFSENQGVQESADISFEFIGKPRRT